MSYIGIPSYRLYRLGWRNMGERIGELEALPQTSCPRCGEPCRLEPTARRGALRLIGADGLPHFPICEGVDV